MRGTPFTRRRRWVRSAVVAGVALTAALAALPAQASVRTANGKPDLSGMTLRVGYSLTNGTANQDIRLASGAFDNTPYQIKWASFATGTQALEGLNAGAIDVTPEANGTSVIVAQSGAKTPWTRATAPFRAVGASAPPADAGVVIGVRPGSGIRKVADLKGKKVTYVGGGPSQLFWAIASREAKLKHGDVEEVNLPQAEGRAALLTGAVDALVAVNRTFIPLVSAGQAQIIARSKGQAPEYRLALARNDFLASKANRALVADFVDRVARSKRWTVKHAAEAADIYAHSMHVPLDDAKAAVEEYPTKVIPLDAALAAALQREAKIFHDYGVTPTNPKLAILFDNRFAPANDTVP